MLPHGAGFNWEIPGFPLFMFMTVAIQHDCWVLETMYKENLGPQCSTKESGGTFRKKNLQEVNSLLVQRGTIASSSSSLALWP